jgi:hypothetical protein
VRWDRVSLEGGEWPSCSEQSKFRGRGEEIVRLLTFSNPFLFNFGNSVLLLLFLCVSDKSASYTETFGSEESIVFRIRDLPDLAEEDWRESRVREEWNSEISSCSTPRLA